MPNEKKYFISYREHVMERESGCSGEDLERVALNNCAVASVSELRSSTLGYLARWSHDVFCTLSP